MKAAVLCHYETNTETYRTCFRSVKCKESEMHSEMVMSLMDSARKWMKNCTSTREMLGQVVLEQFLSTLSPEACIWVKEWKTATSMEAGQLADDHEQARKQTERGPRKAERPATGPRRCYSCGEIGHLVWDCRKSSKGEISLTITTPSLGKEPVLSLKEKCN